ncbi:MAG TPA: CpsB/CapC family capsule biosynthesis tyrosine phosphatase [Cyclobacteriaceae bacterium]
MFKFLVEQLKKINRFNNNENVNALRVDIHSHLLPGLDDGVKSLDESLKIILDLQKMGYRKIITTPHINSNYQNSNSKIITALNTLKHHLKEKKVDIDIDTSAEYMLDSKLIKAVKDKEPLLTFGSKFLLFETSPSEKFSRLEEFIDLTISNGYVPVLAHPERYTYIQNDLRMATEIFDQGAIFQINIRSLGNGYSAKAQRTVRKLIDQGMIHILGSDCHNLEQVNQIKKIQRDRYFQEVLSMPLINNTFLSYNDDKEYQPNVRSMARHTLS